MTTKRGVFCVLSVEFAKPEQHAAFMAAAPFAERARLAAAGIAIEDSELFGTETVVAGKTLKEALTKLAASGSDIEKSDVASHEKTKTGQIRVVTKGAVARDATMKLLAAWLKKRAKTGETYLAVTDTKKRFAITGYLESYDDYAYLEEAFLLIVALAGARGAKALVGFWGDVSLLDEAVHLGVATNGKALEEVRFTEPQDISSKDAASFRSRFGLDFDAITAAHAAWLSHYAQKKTLAKYAGNAGLVRPDGTFAIEPTFPEVGGLHEGLAIFRTSRWMWGYLDASGKEVIAPKYLAAHDFKGGMARVQTDSERKKGKGAEGMKYGFIDRTGAFVIPPTFDAVQDFSDGRALIEQSGKFGFIDAKGTLVIPATFDFASPFTEGRALVCVGDRYDGGQWGYIDTKGGWLVKPTYDSASAFYLGHALIMKKDLWGVIGLDGKVTVAPRFKSAALLVDGTVRVTTAKGEGVYAPDGREIVAPKFDRIGDRGEVYEGGREDDTRVFFTRDGRPVGKLRVANNETAAEGLIPVQWKEGGLWGYADLDGETVVPAKFTAAFTFGQGHAVAVDGEAIVIIDRKGREVARPAVDMELQHATPFGKSGVALLSAEDSALVATDGRVVIGPYLESASGLDDECIWVKYQERG